MKKKFIYAVILTMISTAMYSCDTDVVGSSPNRLVTTTNPATEDAVIEVYTEPEYNYETENTEPITVIQACGQPDTIEIDGITYAYANDGWSQDLIDPNSGSICHFDNGYHSHSYGEACYEGCPSYYGY